MEIALELPQGRGKNRLHSLLNFSQTLKKISEEIGFKISARGWGYQLEGFKLVTKEQFDLVENVVNECRGKGFLPIDFIAEEEARRFSGIEIPEEVSPVQYMKRFLEATLECEGWYTPDWWDGEKYYIQMVVEKIDLKTLFTPICKLYHIPIATSKGWSSMLQRAEYARRFKEAEKKGLICVLLNCGDHDADGLRISDFLRKNLEDLKGIIWGDDTEGYDPSNLIIDRFGLNYDFIEKYELTWIENLITGSGKDLASPSHPNYHMPYVQEYLKRYGARKCEANALVVRPKEAEELCRQAIRRYLGTNALERFEKKREIIKKELRNFRRKTGLTKAVEEALKLIKESD